MSRREELAAGLAAVRRRLAAACAAAGRDPSDVGLVAVTKTFPASDARLLAGLGVLDLGESRDQEARAKAAALADVPELRWHVIGRLQRNKCRSVARYAAVVHSADTLALVAALADGARRADRVLAVLVQVSLDGDPRRGGAPPPDVPALADAVADADGLVLGGVMAVAPLGADPRPAFDRLAAVAAAVRAAHPGATTVSAGMSGDLEAAVAAGSTCVRVGSAILGSRAYGVSFGAVAGSG